MPVVPVLPVIAEASEDSGRSPEFMEVEDDVVQELRQAHRPRRAVLTHRILSRWQGMSARTSALTESTVSLQPLEALGSGGSLSAPSSQNFGLSAVSSGASGTRLPS